MNKQFLKDNKASMTLSVSSPSQKEKRWFTDVEDVNFYQSQESYFIQRRVNLSFNYRFGKLDTQIAKKKRGMTNDM
ncbi:hypothetical protein ABID22_003320 [Pontibacter aydingkolensis]|uniref:Outer membrane beta-barrel family protein n=1 Tax=Pontibacter aydingkolensis TaxID=1911536 RepID=A0ABS7CU85_9BACT|nr:outer membrane beta-barrel family protein [Pontibacter aydingkolensis]